MKIDLHCHTKKTKQGDSSNRNVTKDVFLDKLSGSAVSIVAITNHNHFDIEQFKDFANNDKGIRVFPGVELDITGKESRGHCLLITDPEKMDDFNTFVKELVKETTPDDFYIEIDSFVNKIKDKDYIVIPHYGSKPKALKEADINYLKANIGNLPVLLEPSNFRSAGIMIAHNISTIIGSDVENWNEYSKCNLPELKIPISGYKQFIKLLKKDIPTIDTFVKGKFSEEVVIEPFTYPDCKIKLPIYNDVNVIFGGKGTGKTELLLKEIEKHFVDKGFSDVSTYFPNDNIQDFEKLKIVELKESDLSRLSQDDLSTEFKTINEHKAVTITATSEYYKWINSKLAKQHTFGFVNASFTEPLDVLKNKYEAENKHYESTVSAIESLKQVAVIPYIEEEQINTLNDILRLLEKSSWRAVIESFAKHQSSRLTDWSITKLKTLYQNKTSIFPKPSKLGFVTLFENSLAVYNSAIAIQKAMNLNSKLEREVIGNLLEKGSVRREVEYSVNPSGCKQGSKYLKNTINKGNITAMKKYIDGLVKDSFSTKQQGAITDYKSNCGSFDVKKLSDLLYYNTRIIDEHDVTYEPSPGEKTMLLLNSKLMDDTKNVYILDEPEAKVGHRYINAIIIPRLIELARKDKKIIITTHDANIAVRTLPLLSVYREQDIDSQGTVYRTYVGSPFYDNMRCIEDVTKEKGWVETSMDTLEGGENAFIERGENYGK